jgi:hypothetical protein
MPNRTEEAEVFEDFCKRSGIVLPSDFVHDDAPDFQNPSRPLGVELVSYRRDAHKSKANGSPQRRREATDEDVVAQLRADYYAQRTKRIEVYLHPGRAPLASLSESARFDLLNFIIVKAAGVEAPMPPSIVAAVDGVTTGPLEWWQEDDTWQPVSANFVSVLISAVQGCLDEKEPKVAAYRRRFPEMWLLIHGSPGVYVGSPEARRWSTCGHVTEELRRTEFRTSFDRVYYLDQDRHEYARLIVKAP